MKMSKVMSKNPMTDIKGTEKGSLKAVSQHKAIAMGYEAAPSEPRSMMNQKHKGETGETVVPGFTSMGKTTSKIAMKNTKGAKGSESTPMKKK